MRRLLLAWSLVVLPMAFAGAAAADDQRPTPVSSVAADRSGERAVLADWTIERMSAARPMPRTRRAAPRE